MTTNTYAADHTALLIVDPYNDFMSEGGKLYEATKETAQAAGFYDNMHKLIPAIRAAHTETRTLSLSLGTWIQKSRTFFESLQFNHNCRSLIVSPQVPANSDCARTVHE
jgi:hypothetical protein